MFSQDTVPWIRDPTYHRMNALNWSHHLYSLLVQDFSSQWSKIIPGDSGLLTLVDFKRLIWECWKSSTHIAPSGWAGLVAEDVLKGLLQFWTSTCDVLQVTATRGVLLLTHPRTTMGLQSGEYSLQITLDYLDSIRQAASKWNSKHQQNGIPAIVYSYFNYYTVLLRGVLHTVCHSHFSKLAFGWLLLLVMQTGSAPSRYDTFWLYVPPQRFQQSLGNCAAAHCHSDESQLSLACSHC